MVNRKRGGGSNVSAEAVESHSDLLSEILLRIPAKSLLKFKRVSKQWYNLISSTQFCMEHTRRNPNRRPAGILLTRRGQRGAMRYLKLRKDYQVQKYSMDFCKFPKALLIMDSCNGLFLCTSLYIWSTMQRRPCLWNGRSKLYICNPTTKHVALIQAQLFEEDRNFGKLVLCFDPSTPEKYSVVCLWKINKQGYVIGVYESGTSSWRRSATISEDDYVSEIKGGVFWNGAVHWFDSHRYALYCFDLGQECFRRTTLLPETSSSERSIDIKACQGHLYVSCVDKIDGAFMLTVYEMEHDFTCLSLKYSIRHVCWLGVLGIFLGEEGQTFIVARAGLEVYTYNTNVLNSVPSTTILSGKFPQHFSDDIYTESLVPV